MHSFLNLGDSELLALRHLVLFKCGMCSRGVSILQCEEASDGRVYNMLNHLRYSCTCPTVVLTSATLPDECGELIVHCIITVNV